MRSVTKKTSCNLLVANYFSILVNIFKLFPQSKPWKTHACLSLFPWAVFRWATFHMQTLQTYKNVIDNIRYTNVNHVHSLPSNIIRSTFHTRIFFPRRYDLLNRLLAGSSHNYYNISCFRLRVSINLTAWADELQFLTCLMLIQQHEMTLYIQYIYIRWRLVHKIIFCNDYVRCKS